MFSEPAVAATRPALCPHCLPARWLKHWHVIFWTDDQYAISCFRTNVPLIYELYVGITADLENRMKQHGQPGPLYMDILYCNLEIDMSMGLG
jgi:hypothetical protein